MDWLWQEVRMSKQIPLSQASLAEQEKDGDGYREIAPDVAYRRFCSLPAEAMTTPPL